MRTVNSLTTVTILFSIGATVSTLVKVDLLSTVTTLIMNRPQTNQPSNYCYQLLPHNTLVLRGRGSKGAATVPALLRPAHHVGLEPTPGPNVVPSSLHLYIINVLALGFWTKISDLTSTNVGKQFLSTSAFFSRQIVC